ncbi:MAG: hypothetical protein NTX33_05885 [Propionibacteriales bacterium]|nr:hypothetical protein [Propionibacteriales bacterium]
MTKSTLMDHLLGQVRSALDVSASPSIRATHARTAAETAQDLRDAAAAGRLLLTGGHVVDVLKRNKDALAFREELAQVRDLADLPGLLPTRVLNDGATGYGPAPLIREAADPWSESLIGGTPIVPSFTTVGPFAEVDPTIGPEPDSFALVDVATESAHWSVATLLASKQLLDWIGASGAALLDRIVRDDVDAVAESYVADALVTAAGGTFAAGADLPAALDSAESAAAARGPVRFVVVHPVDLPLVRRALAPTFFTGPHPSLYVSGGQPAGTATFVGSGAVVLLADQVQTMEATAPKSFSTAASTVRPFYLAIRDDEIIQTVTGIEA